MKVIPINLIMVCLVLSNGFVKAQDNSRIYDKIFKLEDESLHIFYDTSLTISEQIKISKIKANQALELGYKRIHERHCTDYSIIVDRMIELEMRLNQQDRAEKIALERLHHEYPGWMDIENTIKVVPDDLYVLYVIHRSRDEEEFYQTVRNNIWGLYRCGTQDNVLGNSLDVAKYLKTQYQDIYSFRFLQNVGLPINTDNDRAIPYWTEIYDLLINMMVVYEDVDSIIQEYNKVSFPASASTMQSSYYRNPHIEVGGVHFYYYPKYELINNRSQVVLPNNLDEIKANSLFYQRLLFYKSMH